VLRIHTVTSASDAKSYYTAADYYSQGQETVGHWGGRLAAQLGLTGTVSKEAFDRLCDNQHPLTGKPLTPRTNDERRVLYDLVFSGPKSFSLLEAFAGDALRGQLLAAFDESVRETLREEIEPDMQARVRRDGAFENRDTGNMVWAEFDHSTARPVDGMPPDPHRHKHVACFNATFDPVEGRIKAGDFARIKRDGEYFAAAFYARLASKLEGMGFGIERRGGKEWEIAGIPQSLIDRFSKRTEEVEEEAEKRGVTDARQKAELGAKTRSKKQKELTPEQLRTAWEAQLSDEDRKALAAVYRQEAIGSRSVSPAEAVWFAIEHCSEKLSVLPERELKRVALLHGLGSVTADQIAAELPRHGVITGKIDGRVMATTEALQREEDFIAGIAAKGLGAVPAVGVAEGLDRTLAGGKRLNDGQWQAVIGLLESPNRVNLLEGPAGAGKSSLLAKLDEGMKLAGEHVTYLATTAAAAEVLQKDGFDAKTVAHFLLDERLQRQAEGGRVVIDESSMLGHKDAVGLYGLAQKLDLKLIHLGDPLQHGAVARGSFLHVLKAYGHIKPFRLTTILRQENPDYRAAAGLLSEGKTVEGFQAIDQMGWVREQASDAERYRQMAAEFVSSWEELKGLPENERVLCVSPTHLESKTITAEIRSQLRASGKLGQEERQFTRLVPVDASEAQKRLATSYRKGDVLLFHQNAKGIKKGERLTVEEPALVPLHLADKFSLYRPEAISLAVGDRIRFTGTVATIDGRHKLRNGMARTVAGFTAKGIRLDNGWVVGKDAGLLRHGWTETSFGSQGRTVRRVILGMAAASLPAMNREQMYVSASRAKERVTLYTDDKEAVAAAIQQSSRKLAALDLKPAEPKPEDRVRRHLEKRRRHAFYERLRAAWAAIRPKSPLRLPLTHADRLDQHRKESGHAR
jgi:conjugative relaxase-like TrwC/TraI family protein